jgi:hypothetical protein
MSIVSSLVAVDNTCAADVDVNGDGAPAPHRTVDACMACCDMLSDRDNKSE